MYVRFLSLTGVVDVELATETSCTWSGLRGSNPLRIVTIQQGRSHWGGYFLRVLKNDMDQKFHNFYRVCYNFWIIHGSFLFFLTDRRNRTRQVGPCEKFLIVDHPKTTMNESLNVRL